MRSSDNELYKIKLIISTNLFPETDIAIGGWQFVKQVHDKKRILLAVTEIESEQYKGVSPKVESVALDAVELPLVALSFCLDGVFRANPNVMEVTSSKSKMPSTVFYEDWRHPTFGRTFTEVECKYAEAVNDAMKSDELSKQLLNYYRLGLNLAHGFYYPSEAFLNFYKVIEKMSWSVCDQYDAEFKARKQQELDDIAGKIMHERRLDDKGHSDKIKINRIKNLIETYVSKREISAKDQVSFTCQKLGLSEEIPVAQRLVEIRNQGGIAHSAQNEEQHWLVELRQCRHIARKFILKHLISKELIGEADYAALMRVPSGIH